MANIHYLCKAIFCRKGKKKEYYFLYKIADSVIFLLDSLFAVYL